MYHKIDIGLDTFPYTGVTTSFEAIPYVHSNFGGYNFTSRCGESININCNLQEFIATDKKDYVKKAVNLCNDLEKVKSLKNLRNCN